MLILIKRNTALPFDQSSNQSFKIITKIKQWLSNSIFVFFQNYGISKKKEKQSTQFKFKINKHKFMLWSQFCCTKNGKKKNIIK